MINPAHSLTANKADFLRYIELVDRINKAHVKALPLPIVKEGVAALKTASK